MPSSKKVTKRSSDSRSLLHRILVAIYDFTGRLNIVYKKGRNCEGGIVFIKSFLDLISGAFKLLLGLHLKMPSSKKVTKRSSDSRSLLHRILVAIYDFTGK
jgi:hypothetical protein